MKTLSRTIALTAAATLALTGCIRIEMNIDLQEDETANGEIIFGLSQDMLAIAGEDSLDELLAEDQDIEGSVTERYESDDVDDNGNPNFVGTRTTFTGQALTEFDAVGDDLRIERDGDDYVISGQPEDLTDQTGGQELPDDAEISLSVSFPGAVSDHNGELDGNTVTWDLITHSGLIEARGSAIDGGGGFPGWLVIAIIALVGVGIGMAVVLVTSSRRKPADESDPATFVADEDGIEGTINTADAGEGTVLPPAEPVVETEQVVDTTADDEDPGRA